MEALLQAGLSNAAWAVALALVAAIGARVWRRRPAVAHVLWLMVLLKLVSPSLVQIPVSRDDASPEAVPAQPGPAGSGESRAAPRPAEDGADQKRASESVAEPTAAAAREMGQGEPAEIPPRPSVARASRPWAWRPVAASLWLAGAGLWWSVVVWNSCRFRRLIRSARPAPAELCERIGQVANRLGLRRTATAWLLPARVPPMIWVPFAGRPRLLLPDELWDRLDVAQQDAVLVHELAHLKRRDHWVRRLEALACGLYWWDPVAWWARREVERAEEQCCDAWVLWALPASATAYAEALVATAVFLSGLRQPLPLGASGVGRLISLKRRLQMILSDGVTSPEARTTSRALLVLGVLSLPFLPALASGEPPGESGRAPSVQLPSRDQPAKAATSPARVDRQPAAVPGPGDQEEGRLPALPVVRVSQPISREVGDHLDVEEPAVLSSQGIELRTLVSGRLDRVCCRIGQMVKKGDLLFEIDSRPYRAELDKADAEVRRARARLRRSADELERARENLRNRIVGQPAIVRAESERDEADAAVQAAQADRDLARLKLESTRVTAPIKGAISRIVEQAGDVVRADQTELAKILLLDPLFVDFYIDEDAAEFLRRSKSGGKMKTGAELELPIRIGVRDEEGFPHLGQLEFLDPKLQPVAEQAVHCRAVIPNPDGALSPGLKARVRLITGAPHRALLIPRAAVRVDEARRYVLVVNERDLVEKRLVRFGPAYHGLREVEQGLKATDWVIIRRPGQDVVGAQVFPERVKPPTEPSPGSQGLQ